MIYDKCVRSMAYLAGFTEFPDPKSTSTTTAEHHWSVPSRVTTECQPNGREFGCRSSGKATPSRSEFHEHGGRFRQFGLVLMPVSRVYGCIKMVLML